MDFIGTRNVFQFALEFDSGNTNKYKERAARTTFKMHDMVHDFARLLMKNECLSIEVNNDSKAISLDDSVGKLRHLHISSEQYRVRCPDSFYNLKKLHSLIISRLVLDLKKMFNNFTSLRLLVLVKCGTVEVPSNINRLTHLRELDLSCNSKLTKLPDTVWELYYLKILNLLGTGVQSVKGVERLTNLREFENSGTKLFLPKEMVRLSGLRRIRRLNIDVDNEEAFSLKHLKNFNQLGGSLVIEWLKGGDADVEDAKQAHLHDKKCITQLVLYVNKPHFVELEDAESLPPFFVSQDVSKRADKQDEELVEALHVPPNLEFLRMHYYTGLRTPNWLNSLTFVKKVGLHDFVYCEHLPPLGKLPCLEALHLSYFLGVRMVDAEFLGMNDTTLSSSSKVVPLFPKLKFLRFVNLYNWEEWNNVDGDEDMLIMPSLTYLELIQCPKLNALPNFILKKTSLKLDIN